ncbi:MAG: ATP-binding protein [Syntrophomonadaceae bacterium]
MIGKLKLKFILTNMLLITIVLAIIFGAVYVSTRQRLEKESSTTLQRAIMENKTGEPDKRDQNRPPSLRESDFKPIPTFTVTLDSDNKIIETNGVLFNLSDTATLDQLVADCLGSGRESGIIEGEDLRYLKQNGPEGLRIAFVDRSMEITTLSSLIKTSVLVGVGSLSVFFLISLFLANLALRPAERAWDQQKQFVADASHELKTPLTVILANAGIVLAHKDQTVEEQAKWIEYIQTEASRMSALVDNLLFLAKTDDVKSKVILNPVNLSDVVWSSVLPFEPVLYEQHKTLDSEIEPDLYINGDESRLKQLVGILLDNACKYADEHGTITVRLFKKAGEVVLSVNNTGGTIPEDQIEHIFERFYRVDKSRARQEGGYGLGLAIAETIAQIHQAPIGVESSPDQGTTFSVVFTSAPLG